MATKHVSQESLKNSNANPVSGVDRLGRTPEEVEADQQEMLKRQYEAGRPFSDAGLAVQRALQGYSGLHDGWGAKPLVGDEGGPNTVDGVYELGRFMARARQEAEYASRDTKDYEQAFIGHMETVADKYNGLTNLDEDALNASKPGEKDDPAQIHIAAVLEKLNAERDEKIQANDNIAARKLEDDIAVVGQYAEIVKSDYADKPVGNEAHDFVVQSELADRTLPDKSVDEEDRKSADETLGDVRKALDKASEYNALIAGGANILANYYPSQKLLEKFAVGKMVNVSGVKDGETSSWQIAGLAPGDKFTVEQKDTEGNYVYKDLSLRELREMNENGGTEPVAAPAVEPAPAPVESSPEQSASAPISPEMKAASERLEGLRSKLAELNARREKRIFAGDAWRGEESDMTSVKALQEDYQSASRELFILENQDVLMDGSVEKIEKIRLIAEHTVTEAKALDTEILENYNNKNTRIGKFIKWYGKRGLASKIAIGGALSIGAGLLTGGAGTALVSGTLMAAGLEAKRREKRGAGDSMVELTAEDLTYQYQGNTNEDAFLGMQSKARDAFDNRIENEQRKRGVRVLGSFVAGATIGTVSHYIVPHMDGMFGGDSAHAVAPDGSSVPAGAEAGADFGSAHNAVSETAANFGPNNIYVNPGDGFNNLFQQMNIPQDQWSSLIDKVGPELVQHGDAYVMPDGSFGVSNVGQLSQQAFETILKSR